MDLQLWVLIPIFMCLIPISALLADAYKKVKDRELIHRERMRALETGQGSEVLASLVAGKPVRPPEPERPKRSAGFQGAIWTGIGGGLLLATALVRWTTDPHGNFEGLVVMSTFLMIWAVPALTVGLSLLIYSAMNRNGRGKGA
jgi:hypothetical protein